MAVSCCHEFITIFVVFFIVLFLSTQLVVVGCCWLLLVVVGCWLLLCHASLLATCNMHRILTSIDEQAVVWDGCLLNANQYIDAVFIVIERIASMQQHGIGGQHATSNNSCITEDNVTSWSATSLHNPLSYLNNIHGFADCFVQSQCETLETLLRAIHKLLDHRMMVVVERMAESASQLESLINRLPDQQLTTPMRLDDASVSACEIWITPAKLHRITLDTSTAYAREYVAATNNNNNHNHLHLHQQVAVIMVLKQLVVVQVGTSTTGT
jgi:hypothetical protein